MAIKIKDLEIKMQTGDHYNNVEIKCWYPHEAEAKAQHVKINGSITPEDLHNVSAFARKLFNIVNEANAEMVALETEDSYAIAPSNGDQEVPV